MTDNVQRLKLALAALTDAFLEKHGCFPLDNAGWKAAMAEAYELVGQPNTIDRSAALTGGMLATHDQTREAEGELPDDFVKFADARYLQGLADGRAEVARGVK